MNERKWTVLFSCAPMDNGVVIEWRMEVKAAGACTAIGKADALLPQGC